MEIGTAIRKLRTSKGFSQRKFAQACEMSVNSLCSIENNNSFPHKTTIIKICRELQVPVGYLMFSCIEERDVPEHKRDMFNDMKPFMEKILLG